ncbi:Ubiquitin carboxyl-terminal hydrolase 42 [Hypsizygus marmoreus]|uniref:Ubiquitin carboxyl-terminal hydrolase n=1 Tax=Hypsizygus marmoreus TaxID=39966 RepID=A0A369JD63_HYPMA|nr:Ubiquitin carboxyl-terminal hydrolase 42 [Hypsizygus marmoreus]
MMLASPLLPTQPTFSTSHVSDDSPLQYRPARDKEAFNSLLPPPIEFVEGSSSGALAVPPGKYEPINGSPRASKPERHEPPKPPASTPTKSTSAPVTTPKTASLFPGGIDSTWPDTCNRGNGLYNSGNTCFLNSALQCLLHTPPLLRVLINHKKDICRVDKGFCMSCSMRSVVVQSHAQKSTFSPTVITNKLQVIAKHMRRGRQEDSHEFLRYAIDALQKSCLAGFSIKTDPKLADTTWVHKIFGGQLRSRVTCHDCGYNSDTFDRILDLSIDIHKSDMLRDALRKFVAVDYLKGADKYKCEKCKKHVVAEKRFTLHEAPLVLTVHLKRFSPLGRKIGHHVQYDEQLSLQPYMSEGHYGPTYSLYGVICHAGGGPNSGHYYAFVKSRDGNWWEMNDESVTMIPGPPVNKKNAYMLFYLRKKGEGLEAAMNPSTGIQKPGLVAGMKKRKEREDERAGDADEDTGTKVSAPFIGPLLPSPTVNGDVSNPKRQKVNGIDPQAVLVKKKIEAAAAKLALKDLDAYASDSDSDSDKPEEIKNGRPSSPLASAKPSSPPRQSSPAAPPPSSPPVPAESFYGSTNPKKRKSYNNISEARKIDARQPFPIQSRSSGYAKPLESPFSRKNMSSTYRRRPRGV